MSAIISTQGLAFEKMALYWPVADFSGLDVSPEMVLPAENKNYKCNRVIFLNNNVYKIPV